MPEREILVDTGPLIAFLSADERDHAWTVNQFKELPAPFLTCEPVLAEACHLLSKGRAPLNRLFALCERGVIAVRFTLSSELESVASLIHKYRELPMSLADGCLVRMVELHPTAAVLTMDHHFRIYRKNGRQPVPVIMPDR